jgi:hypothetical protein
LFPQDKVKITKFIEERSLTIGNFLDVYAVIVSGENENTVVELSMISKEAPGYSVFLDPKYIEPVE